jgi:type I restriction enzyme, S subunit
MINNLKEYQKVDSYWYDKVPYHWKKNKNKYVFNQNKNIVGEDWERLTLLTMGKSGVKPRNMDGGGKFPANFENYQTVEPNQLIFCLFDLDETPRTVGISKDYGMITSAYDVFSTTENNDPNFWTYFYQMLDDHKGLRPFYTGLRKVVRSETFMGIEVFSPPLEEQKLISRYLDKTTEQIDKLIDKIQKKIELLKEQRMSLINQYVTKGLNPNMKMKDSSSKLIKHIPLHWIKTKIKYVAEIFGRIGYRGYTIEDIVDEADGVITISPGNIFEDKFSIKNSTYLSWEKYFESPEIQIFTNDIVIVKTGSTIGKSSIIPESVPEMTINPQLIVLKNLKVNPKFLYYQTLCKFVKDSFYVEQTGSSTPTISQEKIKDFSILETSIQEQKEIVSFLDKETKLIDNTLSNEKKRIDLLKEHRQCLIFEVVTGKIKVLENMI